VLNPGACYRAIMERKRRRPVAQHDEFALIASLRHVLPSEPSWVRIGRGADDTAVLDLGGRDWFVWTCDTLVENVHFRQRWLSARELGRRAASVNLSDVAAMGARPLAALASLHLPPSLERSAYQQIMRGLGEQLAAHGASLVGGNLSRAAALSIDVSLLGRTRGHRVAARGGARPGDRVLVTGFPGEAAAGLHGLRRRGADAPRSPLLRRRWVAPTPRVQAGQLLLQGGATSMIDISDGLLADLGHLCTVSGVGVEVDRDRLPLSAALRRYAYRVRRDPVDWLLHGGEDYELLCTLPRRRVAVLQKRLQEVLGLSLTEIGTILPARHGRWLRSGSQRRRLAAGGHRHFGKSRP
jgi:thiamine-monophosphate kinase